MAEHEREMEELRQRVIAMESKITEINDSVKGLVKAWEAAGTLVGLVKWAASIVTAAGVLWAAVTHTGKS